ncbi:TPA: hypothetical protein VBX77_001411 [Yersinia enterocolitica]|nr:hypothetical protein [Yersinia enterocolitica]
MQQNIDFTRIIRYFGFTLDNKSIVKKIIYLVFLLTKSLLIRLYPENSRLNVDFLFLSTTNRDDHNKLFNHIYEQCNFNKEKITFKKKYRLKLNFFLKIITNKELINSIDDKYSNLSRFIIYLQILNLLEIVKEFKSLKCNYLIVYSDVQPIEDILVQFAKFRNIKTVSLQHGLYIEYKEYPNLNMLNYLYLKSDFFLSWGKETAQLIKKYNENIQTINCGKPIEKMEIGLRQKENHITIIFDQPMFSSYNKILLEIGLEMAYMNDYKILLKLHPTDKIENYSIDNNKIVDDRLIERSQYILGHTSTMIYELLVKGLQVYKLKSDIPSNKLPVELTFSSINELKEIIKGEHDFINIGSKYIEYIDNDSLKRYREFFEKLHDKGFVEIS